MIISDKSAIEKLNSPHNLINQLRDKKNNAMSLFIPQISKAKEIINPFKKEEVLKDEPKLDNLIENNEAQVKLSLAHDQALSLLNQSTKLLFDKLDDVRADKLPGVITAAGKIVESIRRERSEASRSNKDREVHHHFYMPQQKALKDFAIIDI